MARDFFRLNAAPRRRQWKQRLHLERLERRAVLCAVTCVLDDGTLTVEASEGEDQIAIVMDHGQQSIQVFASGESAGRFAVAEVQALRVIGLEANDQIEIDDSLAWAVERGQADGEAANEVHNHAVALAAATESVLLPTILGSEYETNHTHSTESTALTTSLTADISSHHRASLTSAAVPNVASEDHSQHSIIANSLAASSTNSAAEVGVGLFSLARVAGRGAGNSGHHGTTFDRKSATSAELAPKFCTTTPFAKQLITNVEGKPECSCEQKKKSDGVEGVGITKYLVAGSEQMNPRLMIDLNWGLTSRRNNGVECRPCQAEFLAGSMTGEEICSMRAPEQVIQEITAETKQLAEQLRANAGDDDSNNYSVETSSTNLSLLFGWETEQLQAAGWILVAAGAAMLPLIWHREHRTDRDQREMSSGNWWLGGFEVLTT